MSNDTPDGTTRHGTTTAEGSSGADGALRSLRIVVHKIHPRPYGNHNRDESGHPKHIELGRATRAVISPRAIKRAIRDTPAIADRAARGGRAPETPSGMCLRRIAEEVRDAQGLTEAVAAAAALPFVPRIFGGDEPDGRNGFRMTALESKGHVKLTHGETERLGEMIADAVNGLEDPEDPEEALRRGRDAADRFREEITTMGAGLDTACFGRHAPGDALARVASAIRFSPEISVEASPFQRDTVGVTDMWDAFRAEGAAAPDERADPPAAVHGKSVTHHKSYSHMIIDVPLLVANVEGVSPEAWHTADTEASADMVETVVREFARVVPPGMRAQYAPDDAAETVLLEIGWGTGCSLVEAFREPSDGTTADVNARMAGRIEEMDRVHGRACLRFASTIEPGRSFPAARDAGDGGVTSLAATAGGAVRNPIRTRDALPDPTDAGEDLMALALDADGSRTPRPQSPK